MTLSPFLTDTERGIYEQGTRDLMRALLAGRANGEHGTISLQCGLGAHGVRSAHVLRETSVQVVVAPNAARA